MEPSLRLPPRPLAANRDVTAVLCGNDDLAFGVIHAMREAGRPVPDEVSVVGFDDIPQAAFYAPRLPPYGWTSSAWDVTASG